jgi:hypothetical protein
MSALAICLIIWALLVGGALAGVLLRRLLPDHHLDTHAKDIVRLGSALIATIAGLVLGLLINSAKSTFDVQRDEIRQLTANFILLDHQLERYGPETRPVRVHLRDMVVTVIDRIWKESAIHAGPFTATPATMAAEQAIQSLTPTNDSQRRYQSQSIQTLNAILQVRAILYEESGAQLPTPFLVIVVFWLFILFVSFSLFSPLNPTALGAILVIALSGAGAIFLVIEMSEPFTGLMRIDSEPLRQALPRLIA